MQFYPVTSFITLFNANVSLCYVCNPKCPVCLFPVHSKCIIMLFTSLNVLFVSFQRIAKRQKNIELSKKWKEKIYADTPQTEQWMSKTTFLIAFRIHHDMNNEWTRPLIAFMVCPKLNNEWTRPPSKFNSWYTTTLTMNEQVH